MAAGPVRIRISLDGEQAAKLQRLADRTGTSPSIIARFLISSALDEADPDPANIAAIVDGIPGAWEDAQAVLEEARRGAPVPLDDLK